MSLLGLTFAEYRAQSRALENGTADFVESDLLTDEQADSVAAMLILLNTQAQQLEAMLETAIEKKTPAFCPIAQARAAVMLARDDVDFVLRNHRIAKAAKAGQRKKARH